MARRSSGLRLGASLPEDDAFQPAPEGGPIMTLQPVIEKEVPEKTTIDEHPDRSGTWPAFVRALADTSCNERPIVLPSPAPGPLPLKRVGQWSVMFVPHYSGSTKASAVDEAVNKRDASRCREILQASAFHITPEWSFAAVDATRGATVRLVDETKDLASRPAQGPAEVRVQRWKESDWTAGVRVTFPTGPPDAVYKVVTDLRLADTAGNQGRSSHCLWSHGVSGDDPDAVVDWALRAACGPAAPTAARLRQLAVGQTAPRRDRSRESGVRQILFSVAGFVDDGVVSTEELARLIEGARTVCRDVP